MSKVVMSGKEFIDPKRIDDFLAGLYPEERKVPLEVMSMRPQPKQERMLDACGLLDWYYGRGGIKPAICSMLGFGGAAYGSKTYGLLLLAATAALAWPGVQIVFFRRTYRQIFGPGGVINDARSVFAGMGEWKDEMREFEFKTGSRFYFRHCENESDVYGYDGQQFDILMIDEATHFTWFQVDYLYGRNRVSGPNGIPRPFTILCSNPGNIGHSWYYQLFDLGHKVVGEKNTTAYEQIKTVTNGSGKRIKTYFILSLMTDNQIGLQRDPEYPERLMTQDPARAGALMKGDWETFSGQMFVEFTRDRHVIPIQAFPSEWPVIVGVDSGTFDPFCALFAKVQPRTGRIYVYKEIYQAGLTADVQAERIVMATTKEENILVYYADPSMWNKESGRQNQFRSDADDYLSKGIFLSRGDNNRVQGCSKVHKYLADGADGKPLLQITENCYNLIEELPKLPRDTNNPEDVDPKAAQDHGYSSLRYLLSNVDLYLPKEAEKPADKRMQRMNPNPMMRIPGL